MSRPDPKSLQLFEFLKEVIPVVVPCSTSRTRMQLRMVLGVNDPTVGRIVNLNTELLEVVSKRIRQGARGQVLT